MDRRRAEIERATVTKANPRLMVHTVQSMEWGAELGWTTVIAHRASVKAILRELKLARVAGRLRGSARHEMQFQSNAKTSTTPQTTISTFPHILHRPSQTTVRPYPIRIRIVEALAARGRINIFAVWRQVAKRSLVGVLGVILCNVTGINIGATTLLTKIVHAA